MTYLDASIQKCEHPSNLLDIRVAVQPMSFDGSRRLQQSITPLPCTQGDGLDARQGRDGPDWKAFGTDHDALH
jgi:hypothetical protein